MADEDLKIYTPTVIEDLPFPNQIEQPESFATSENSTKDVQKQKSITDTPAPRRIIAHETIGQALNTHSRRILGEFQFTESGALQIGKYQEGISGDIRISPTGILARDLSGNQTFLLDAETGDAVFRGSVILGGNLVIENEEGTAILDSLGLISSSNFNFDQKKAEESQNTTSTSYVDKTNPQLSFVIPGDRPVRVLFFGTLTMSSGGSSPGYAILSLEDNVSLGGTMVLANLSSGCLVAISDVDPGEHTLKFRFRKDLSSSVTITADPCILGYLILGR